MTDLTDEQLGRLWCERTGRHPRETPASTPDEPQYDMGHFTVREPIVWAAFGHGGGVWCYGSAGEAYAAVGEALRAVWEFAERSKREVQGD